MAKPFPLQPLLDLAQDRMDDAARRLGELIARENEDQRKLEMLEHYRTEYLARFNEAARNGLGPDAWRNYSAFIGKIDEAIEQQRRQLERTRHHTATGQQAWVTERNQVKAFDTLSRRHQEGLLHQEARQEQRASDEHSAKLFRDPERRQP